MRRNLLAEIRNALKDPRIVVLDEKVWTHSVSAHGLDESAKGLQTVNINITPAKGIYHIDANQYWTETGKNLPGWDYFWGHWKCAEVDGLNQLLAEIFSSVKEGTLTNWYDRVTLEEMIGGVGQLNFRFEPGELKPTEADRIEEADKVKDWFEQNKPTYFTFPTITAKEVIGIGKKEDTFSYQVFPEFHQDFKEKVRAGTKSGSSEYGLNRVIEIECYPCREFYLEQTKLLRLRHKNFKTLVEKRKSAGKGPTEEDYERSRKQDSYLDKELEKIGCDSSDLTKRIIHLNPYNQYFKSLIS